MHIIWKKNVENFTKPITLMNGFAVLPLIMVFFFKAFSKWVGGSKIPSLITVKLWIAFIKQKHFFTGILCCLNFRPR